MTGALDAAQRAFLDAARTATLATMSPDGQPRLVPVCFVIASGPDAAGRALLYTPLDEKPKAVTDPHALARVRDILVLPDVALLVDRWSEDWTRLAWLRAYGRGQLLEPQADERAEHTAAVAALRLKYSQYESHALEARPIIRVAIERVVTWGAIGD
jgi:PPOX class probable F420-dependent enzyme